MKITKAKMAFTLIELLVVISIIAILASIALPAFTQVQIRGRQTQDLSNAKQVYLACKLFANDNGGLFPYQSVVTGSNAAAGTASNVVYGTLFPNYLTTEDIFWVGYPSGWSPNKPNNNISGGVADILPTGTNNYGYMLNLSDTSNPNYPLIFDAPAPGGTIYAANGKGGVWAGQKAVVVFCDGHGVVQPLVPVTGNNTGLPSYTMPGNTGLAAQADVLKPVAAGGAGVPGWMDPTSNFLLYPN